jgi:transposase
MNTALLPETLLLAEQVRLLLATVECLRHEVAELRVENADLRQEVRELRCDVAYWKSRHAHAVQRNVKLQAELDQAKAEIRQLKAERFGKRSEKQSSTDRSNQLSDPQTPVSPKKRRGQQPGKPAPQRRDYSHLPVCEEVVDVAEQDKVCPCCGLSLESVGYGADHEQIEIETVVYRRVIKRKRYRRTCSCEVSAKTLTAVLPPKLLPKSIYGTSIWVHLLLEKFHLQRPTHRTIEQLRLLGVHLAAGTIADGLKRIEPLLTPIYEAIRAHQRESTYYHADETRWKVFAEKAGKAGYSWWLWLFAGEDSVVFVLDPSRSHNVPQAHFAKNAEGVLSVDRYSGYKAMQQVKNGTLVLAFCWAHVRRDFVRVGKGYPQQKSWALKWLSRIRELYQLNRTRLKHPPDSLEFAAADAKLREQVAMMATERDAELSLTTLHYACPKVLKSLSEHWTGLTLFVDDPVIPLDNNYGERLIRGPTVGRKNYYGSGSPWSGRLAMMLFTLFATLVLWKINPRTWLSWYFDACAANEGKAPAACENFLPWNLSDLRLNELRSPTLNVPADSS